jgi:hypothetical protein
MAAAYTTRIRGSKRKHNSSRVAKGCIALEVGLRVGPIGGLMIGPVTGP